ncbi:MAG: GntR family transcriptional regulator [Gemmatimonadetes bacterium]|nr:GntR family transcriptional regulator [Gemmatimonadota bacterium]
MTSRDGAGPLCRDHFIPLNRQLAAGLEAAIRDGHIRPGAPLPATRDLARRLDVSRSTVGAAYARLRRRGCIASSRGGRAVAPRRRGGPSTLENRGETLESRGDAAGCPSVDELAETAVQRALGIALDNGLSRRAVASAVAERCPVDGPSELVLLEPRPGLRRALVAEIETRLSMSVRPVRGVGEAPAGVPIAVRREVLRELRRRSPGASSRVGRAAREWIPLDLAGGTRERGIVRRSVRGGVVVFLSVSRGLRRYAAELASREFARGVSFAAIDPRDTQTAVRGAALARLVFHDAASSPPVSTRGRVERVGLLSARQLGALGAYLGVPDRGEPPIRPRCGT